MLAYQDCINEDGMADGMGADGAVRKHSSFSLVLHEASASSPSPSSPSSSFSSTQRCVEPEWSCLVMVNSVAVCNHVGQHGAVFWRLVPPLLPIVDEAVCGSVGSLCQQRRVPCFSTDLVGELLQRNLCLTLLWLECRAEAAVAGPSGHVTPGSFIQVRGLCISNAWLMDGFPGDMIVLCCV
ncbi:hypothetical protein RJT34_32113 [Clitoria ternatea]|uniref:Uncharacterized protein n=1 Tax=Clitoria ternatea TaxID=43366 RepID=A0AAN9I480_CLITE